jgi:hypothetical protein
VSGQPVLCAGSISLLALISARPTPSQAGPYFDQVDDDLIILIPYFFAGTWVAQADYGLESLVYDINFEGKLAIDDFLGHILQRSFFKYSLFIKSRPLNQSGSILSYLNLFFIERSLFMNSSTSSLKASWESMNFSYNFLQRSWE